MKLLFISVSLLCLFLLWEAESVSRSNFRTCQQTGFCKRNRKLADHPKDSFTLTPYSLKLENDDTLSGTLVDKLTGLPYKMEITIYNDAFVRFKVSEVSPKAKRYEPKEVLEEEQLSKSRIEYNNKDGSISFDNGRKKLVLTESPFRLSVFIGEDEAIAFNQRGLLTYEHSGRSQEEPSDPEDGLWQENFNSHPDTKPNGPMSVAYDVTFPGSSHVFGIPEHADDFKLKPTRGAGISRDPYRLYNLDVFEYELHETMALYGSIPFMFSQDEKKTAGVFWLNAAEMFIDVGYEGGNAETHWIAETGFLDVFFFVSRTPYDVFKQYGQLTGYTALPQLFSLGYHQCRWNYRDEADVENVNKLFDENSLSYDVIWLDIEHTDGKRYFTWDRTHFPNPEQMAQNIEKHGRKMVTIVDPHIKRDPGYFLHSEATSLGYYVKTPEGGDFDGWCWPGSSSYLDFTSPQVREFWANKFSYDVYKGSSHITYTWNDMNEPSVFNGPEITMRKDMKHVDGFEHRDVHNQYGQFQHMATALGLVKRNSGENDRPFVLSRAFFAGSQKHGAIWTGDNYAAWDHLEYSVHMLLSLQITGMAFSGADVGGFYKHPDGELMSRWYQLGIFQPFFRGHAHLDSPRREPWTYGEPYLSYIRKSIRTRYALLPHWYTLFWNSSVTGIPPMRPVWAEFPTDKATFDLQLEYLVGSHILVTPVVKPGTTSVPVYFPEGEWYPFDVNVGERTVGPAQKDVSVPADNIPVYVRGGAILPLKLRPRRSSSQMQDDPFTLAVYLDKNGNAQGQLYVDDGHSFDYKQGQYLVANFTFSQFKELKFSVQPPSQVPVSTLSSFFGAKKQNLEVKNTVERVKIFGLAKQPQSITSSSSATPLDWHLDTKEGCLVVRKPFFSISKDWSFSLVY
eukprot:TRINITY_DN3807_c0_g1_i1.p1 TRINITY_DN3807_c0_g1~~TRINITY_DN3807_c0_g1_i1.p1  ORF type:complete len:904 (-),score=280.94 TRINITY_DN3807_c0_g1_i1:119-2830(-)